MINTNIYNLLLSQRSCDRALASFYKVQVNEANLFLGNPLLFFSNRHFMQKQHDIQVCNRMATLACIEFILLSQQTDDKVVAECLLIAMKTFIKELGDYQELVKINPSLLLYHSIRRMEEVIAA